VNPTVKSVVEVDSNLPPFCIAYQPIVNVPARRVVGYEALVRGIGGISYPQLIAGMDTDTLRLFHHKAAEEAIRCAVELGLNRRKASLTLNLSPDLDPRALNADFIRQAAERYGMPIDQIVIELTEDHRLTVEDLRKLLNCNRDSGFTSAMDDFGAGYAGLTALVDCRPEILKLDRALIRDIDASESRQRIVGAFVRICSALGMIVIAEGVETLAECRQLRQLGIWYIQGYFFSRPIVNALPKFEDCAGMRSLRSIGRRGAQADSRILLPARHHAVGLTPQVGTA